jgi:hypothetical protein
MYFLLVFHVYHRTVLLREIEPTLSYDGQLHTPAALHSISNPSRIHGIYDPSTASERVQ